MKNDLFGRVSDGHIFKDGDNLFNQLNKDKLSILDGYDEISKLSLSKIDQMTKDETQKVSDILHNLEISNDMNNVYRSIIKLFAIRNIISINYLFRKLFIYEISEEDYSLSLKLKDSRFTKYYNYYKEHIEMKNPKEKDYIRGDYKTIIAKTGFRSLSFKDIRDMNQFLVVYDFQNHEEINDIKTISSEEWINVYNRVYKFAYDHFIEDNTDNVMRTTFKRAIQTEKDHISKDWRIFSISSNLVSKLVNELNTQSILSSNYCAYENYHNEGDFYLEDKRNIELIFTTLNSIISKNIKECMSNKLFMKNEITGIGTNLNNFVALLNSLYVRDTINEITYDISISSSSPLSSLRNTVIKLNTVNLIDFNNDTRTRILNNESYCKNSITYNTDLNCIDVLLKFHKTNIGINDFSLFEDELKEDDSLINLYYSYNLVVSEYCQDSLEFDAISYFENLTKLSYNIDLNFIDKFNDYENKLFIRNSKTEELTLNIQPDMLDFVKYDREIYYMFDKIYSSNLYKHNKVNVDMSLSSNVYIRDKDGENPLYWMYFLKDELIPINPNEKEEEVKYLNNFKLNEFKKCIERIYGNIDINFIDIKNIILKNHPSNFIKDINENMLNTCIFQKYMNLVQKSL